MENRLKIVATSSEPEKSSTSYAGGKSRRLEAQAVYDRLWQQNPHAQDPERNIMEKVRLERTLDLIKKQLALSQTYVCDLGCGTGTFARMLRDEGAKVDAVDISLVALNLLKEKDITNIVPIHAYVPMTSLRDNDYDLVACLDLVADLRPDEHRLLFSELARLVKNEGYVVSSTSLDIDSEDALQRFTALVESELQIQDSALGYHRLWIRLKDIVQAPARFYRASRDREYQQHKLSQRSSFSKVWFSFNSTYFLGSFWGLIAFLLKPIVYFIKYSRTLLLTLERLCKFWWSDAGITHAIFIGQRRPLFLNLPEKEVPKERKQKRQVWE